MFNQGIIYKTRNDIPQCYENNHKQKCLKTCFNEDTWLNIGIFLQIFLAFIVMGLVYYLVHELILIPIYHFMAFNLDKKILDCRSEKNNEKTIVWRTLF